MSMPVQLRFKHAEILAEQYADFKDFAADAMRFLGFSPSDTRGCTRSG